VYAGARDPSTVTQPGVEAIRLDVTKPEEVGAAAARAGGMTVVINNAGVGHQGGFLAADSEEVARRQFETNFFGMLRNEQGRPSGAQGQRRRRPAQCAVDRLVENGVNDITVPTINSWIMSQHIPQAQPIVYPDAGHAGALPVPGAVPETRQDFSGFVINVGENQQYSSRLFRCSI
jgi:NAD(P)-dependent dehydrogenase (short-subunit alcohol dehydrogenase family)